MEVAPGRAPEHRDELPLGQQSHLPDSRDPALVQLAGGDPANAPQPLNRERMQEFELALGRHHQQAVGLGHGARDLRQELGAGDADGDRQTDLLADPPPQPDRDLDRGPGDVVEPADVQKCLVDRQALDHRRRVLEHLEHRLARLRVGGHPRRHDDRLGAQPAGPTSAHRGADPARLGLVAGGEHDAGADDHRAAAEPGIVALLDRRVERVEVRVQDRGRGRHEHMFGSPSDGLSLAVCCQSPA